MPGQNKYCRDNHGGLICMKLFWSGPQRLSAAPHPPFDPFLGTPRPHRRSRPRGALHRGLHRAWHLAWHRAWHRVLLS